MTWVLVALAAIGLLFYLIARSRSKNLSSREPAAPPTVQWPEQLLASDRPGKFVVAPRPSAVLPPGPLSAGQILSEVQALMQVNVSWLQIFSRLNPENDAEIAGLLGKLRDANASAGIGLALIAKGCRQALYQSPQARGVEALRQALPSPDPNPPAETLPPLFDGEGVLIDEIYRVFRDEKRYSDLNRVAVAEKAKSDLVKRNVDRGEFLRRFQAKTGDKIAREMLAAQWRDQPGRPAA